MDSKNASRIKTAINSLNCVTTKDADTARWLIDVIEQLEEITAVDDDARIDEWRKMLGARNGR